MKKYLVIFLLTTLIITTPTLGYKFASDYLPQNVGEVHELVHDLIEQGTLPSDASKMLTSNITKFKHAPFGNFSRVITPKGVINLVTITIYGNGTKLGPANTTQFAANNQTVNALNLLYYPRNITLTFKGYEWWNNTNQHIVNDSGVTISTASIYENNGTAKVVDYYTTNNPIWQSKHVNITVNTTAAWLEINDSVAENISVVYNITIDDGTFTAFRFLNNSFYVAPNATAAATQDDLNIYVSNDSGTTWYLVVDGADGSTSTGTQWTGIVDLLTYAQGKSSLLINITFGSDGADDAAGVSDLHFDNFSLIVQVSKLPTRAPKVDLDNDGTWDYGTIGSFTNGSSASVSIGDLALNLTNNIKVYAEGSQKVIINFTWNDENRTAFRQIVFGDNITNLGYVFVGDNVTINRTLYLNNTLYGELSLFIYNDPHTKNRHFRFNLTLETQKFMCIQNANLTITLDGVTVRSFKSYGASTPIPVFVKPRYSGVDVRVNVWNPSAYAGAELFNMTISSPVHDEVVDVIVTNISEGITMVQLYKDGNLVDNLTVTDGMVTFNITGFSEHIIVLKPVSVAVIAPPEEIDWYWVVSVIAFAALLMVLLYLGLAALRRR